MSAPLTYEQERVLVDLCDCPGLFAGQYPGLDDLPSMYVERRYDGVAGFMGLPKAWPTQAAHDYLDGAA